MLDTKEQLTYQANLFDLGKCTKANRLLKFMPNLKQNQNQKSRTMMSDSKRQFARMLSKSIINVSI